MRLMACDIDQRVVQLRSDGTYKFLPWEDPDDWPAFLSLINLTNWVNK